jgi:glycosyltransferase involved in cell wall biosynthesis
MRIQLIGPGLEVPGGVSNFLGLLRSRLSRRPGMRVDYLPVGGGRSRGNGFHLIGDQWRMRRALGRGEPDLVHINPSLGMGSLLRDGFIVRSAKRRGHRVLVFFHGWSWEVAGRIDRNAELRRFFQTSLGRADAFVILASAFERKLREWGLRQPIFRGVTMVADESVHLPSVHEKLRNLEVGRSALPLRILFLSRLEPSKGALETVQAAHRLVDQGCPVRLTVAGSGPAQLDIERYLRRHPALRGAVRLTGHVRGREKDALFASHGLFAFPTRYGEGLPTVVVEAMAHGMPVVTCPSGGIADFFVPDRMGAFTAPDDIDELARVFRHFWERPGELRRKGLFNCSYAQANFYSSKVVDRLVEVYSRAARKAVPLRPRGGTGGDTDFPADVVSENRPSFSEERV